MLQFDEKHFNWCFTLLSIYKEDYCKNYRIARCLRQSEASVLRCTVATNLYYCSGSLCLTLSSYRLLLFRSLRPPVWELRGPQLRVGPELGTSPPRTGGILTGELLANTYRSVLPARSLGRRRSDRTRYKRDIRSVDSSMWPALPFLSPATNGSGRDVFVCHRQL